MTQSANDPITIDVVSDVVCPWCYVGKHRLEQALASMPERKWPETRRILPIQRPAVRRGKEAGAELRRPQTVHSEEERRILFGQTAATVR